MIDVTNGQDRGKTLYAQYSDQIEKRLNDHIESYFGSQKDYIALKRRVQTFDDLYDLRFKGTDAFIAEIAVPVSRKIMQETTAYIRKYFENDPLFSLWAMFETSNENRDIAEKVLNYNLQMTNYRRDALMWHSYCASNYGCYVNFAQYVEGFGQRGRITRYNSNALELYESVQSEPTRKNVVNYPVHPLNYFQDTSAIFSYEPEFKGFIDKWSIQRFYSLVNDERYITENIKDIADRAKKGMTDSHYYGNEGRDANNVKLDSNSRSVHIRRIWAKLPIDGNEDDDTTYYIEMAQDKIIRIEENQYDKDVCPLSTGVMLPRVNVWWGNATHESKAAHQNLMNWLINTQVESTMKAMDRIVFVRKGGGVDWSAVNNRHRTGGIVPVEGMEPLSQLAYPLQFQDSGLKGVDWLVRELKEEIQADNPVTNLQSNYNQGGLNNKTLGAANMIAQIGEILQSNVMTNFGYGQVKIAHTNLTQLQQLLEDKFFVKNSLDGDPVMVEKWKILGDFNPVVETSMKINEFQQFTQKANLLTQLFNWRAAGKDLPIFNGVNWSEILKDIIKNGVGHNVDLQKYYTEQTPMQQPINPAMQGANGLGAMGNVGMPMGTGQGAIAQGVPPQAPQGLPAQPGAGGVA